ncbi:MAG: galactose oxidase [Bacteroidales bacterium]|nr:galactose oxidase [Bacteroidales bacterium]
MKIARNLLLLGLFVISTVTTVISCKGGDDDDDLIGNWIELDDLGGDARSEAVAFSIGNVGYVGTGYNGEDHLKDFWSFNTETNKWIEVASLPENASPRISAVAFSAAGKGYVGTGWNGDERLADFWVYNPESNTWDTLNASAGDAPSARYGAVAFSVNDIGYVGTGYDGSTLLDFYAYNPASNTWSPVANYPTKVREAVAFVLNNKGYVVTGEKNGEHINDFNMYDPETNAWTYMRKVSPVSDEDYDDSYTIIRKKAVAFVVGSKAYVTAGDLNSSNKTDTWEYDASTDEWTARTNFEGTARNNAVAFSTANGRGFVCTGQSSTSYFDDLWEFRPADEYDDED